MRYIAAATDLPAEATETTGPMIVNTASGEICTTPGHWIVYQAGCWPQVLSPDEFAARFIPASE